MIVFVLVCVIISFVCALLLFLFCCWCYRPVFPCRVCCCRVLLLMLVCVVAVLLCLPSHALLRCFLCVFVSLFAVIVVNADNGFVLLLAPRVYALSDRLCAGVCARAFCFCLAVAVSLISVRPLCFAARACLVCVHVFVRGCCRLQYVPAFVFVALVLSLSVCVVVVCARCFCCCRC